ncbi:MAG: LysR family transcriptional regulator [Burkholderiales bacterium]
MSDLKAINYFVEVARTGSFSGAARSLRLTQPAVSRLVRKLERDIGVPLLWRDGRSVAPTEAGRILLARATALNQAFTSTFAEVRAGAEVPSGPLSLGVSMIIGHMIMPPLIHGFVRKFPNLKLHLYEGYSRFVEEWLVQERIEAGLIWGKPRASGLVLDPLLALEMSLVAPARPLPGCEPGPRALKQVRFRDLVRFPLILPAPPHGLRMLAERAAEEANRPLTIAMECDGVVLARELVKAGVGYTFMALTGATEDVARGHIREIRIGPPRIYWTLSMATREGTRPSLGVRELATEIRRLAAQQIAAGALRGRVLAPA